MILFSHDPREPACRQKLVDALGAEDADTLVRWFWERHGDSATAPFGAVLVAMTAKIETSGTSFAKNLLDAARKPKAVSEAELEIMAWILPLIDAAATKVLGHRGAGDVAAEEFSNLVRALEEKLWRMFPDKHRATMKGAIVVSFTHKNGEFAINVEKLVHALFLQDPLAATARSSRG